MPPSVIAPTVEILGTLMWLRYQDARTCAYVRIGNPVRDHVRAVITYVRKSTYVRNRAETVREIACRRFECAKRAHVFVQGAVKAKAEQKGVRVQTDTTRLGLRPLRAFGHVTARRVR